MGACVSKTKGATQDAAAPGAVASREIDKQLREVSTGLFWRWRQARLERKLTLQEEKRLQGEVKLLLLGSGASGKSTVLKQMRYIHAKPFTPDEIEDYRCVSGWWPSANRL